MTRDHLSIGEVLNLVQEEFPDVTISKIRFLESQGLLDPERTPSGYRKFYDEDIERLRWILRQQRENFLPLKVIKDRLVAGELDEPDEVAPAVAEVVDVGDVGDVGDVVAVAEVVEVEDGAVDGAGVELLALDLGTAVEVAQGDDEADDREGGSTASPAPPGRPDPAVVPALVEGPARPPAPAPATVSLSLEELCSATGLTAREVGELERFGLVAARSLGPTSYYDGDALAVAGLAARFMVHGVEPRHLRMYKLAAEREVAVVDQLALPLLQQRRPEARQQVADLVGELSGLGGQLRAALVDGALRHYRG